MKRYSHKDLAKRLQGLKAKKEGSGFEIWLEKAMGRVGWHLIGIEDGCKAGGPGGALIRVTQPFDFVGLGPNLEVIFFDAKLRSGSDRIRPSWLTGAMKHGKPDSTMKQYRKLCEIQKRGHRAGFVVMLKDSGDIRWVDALSVPECAEKNVHWGKFGGSTLRVSFGIADQEPGELPY